MKKSLTGFFIEKSSMIVSAPRRINDLPISASRLDVRIERQRCKRFSFFSKPLADTKDAAWRKYRCLSHDQKSEHSDVFESMTHCQSDLRNYALTQQDQTIAVHKKESTVFQRFSGLYRSACHPLKKQTPDSFFSQLLNLHVRTSHIFSSHSNLIFPSHPRADYARISAIFFQ